MIKRMMKGNQRKGRNYEVEENLNDTKDSTRKINQYITRNTGEEKVIITAKK